MKAQDRGRGKEGRKGGRKEGNKEQILQQDHLGRRFPLKFKHFDAHQYNIDDKMMPDDEGWRGDDDYYIFTSTNKVMLYIFSK